MKESKEQIEVIYDPGWFKLLEEANDILDQKEERIQVNTEIGKIRTLESMNWKIIGQQSPYDEENKGILRTHFFFTK